MNKSAVAARHCEGYRAYEQHCPRIKRRMKAWWAPWRQPVYASWHRTHGTASISKPSQHRQVIKTRADPNKHVTGREEQKVEGKMWISYWGDRFEHSQFFMEDAVVPHSNANQQFHLCTGADAELKICICMPRGHTGSTAQSCPTLAARRERSSALEKQQSCWLHKRWGWAATRSHQALTFTRAGCIVFCSI